MFFSRDIFRLKWRAQIPLQRWIPTKAGEEKTLAASVSGSTTVSGALTVRKKLAVVIGSGTSTFGELTLSKPLASSTAGTTTVTVDLHLVKPLAGSVSGSTTVSGDISTAQLLRGTVSGDTTVSGALSVTKPLAASTTGTTTVSGNLAVRKKLASSTTGTTSVSGALRVRKKLAVVIGSGTSIFGELTVNAGAHRLAGQVSGTTTVTGALSVIKRLAGSVSGSTTVTVSLQIGLAPILPASVIVRQILINTGQASSFGTEWKVYNAFLPDMPDRAIVVYDSAGIDDGRIMQGEKILHPGVSIQVRSRDYLDAWRKTNRIAEILDQQRRTLIEVPDQSAYRVHNVSRKGDILTMGMEPQGDKRRHYFSINAALTLEKIST